MRVRSGLHRGSRLLTTMVVVPMTIAAITIAFPGSNVVTALAANPTHYPVAALLCTSADQGTTQELATGYYQAMFSPGSGGVADWFGEVSRGGMDLAGTQVLGPYVVQSAGPAYPPGTAMTLPRMNGLRRFDRLQACAGAAADAGVDLTQFQGIIAIEVAHERDPAFTPPIGVTTLAAAATSTATTIQVSSSSGFPAPPFPALIGVGDAQNGGSLTEVVDVTAESGPQNTTWTVARGFEMGGPGGLNNCAQGGPSPSNGVALGAGLQVEVPHAADGGACFVGRVNNFTVGSVNPETLNNIGLVTMDPLMSLAVLPHEMSHALLGLVHSSDLVAQSDYQDPWDMMSAARTFQSRTEPGFVQLFNYDQNAEKALWTEGPGFNSVNLDNFGWLTSAQQDTTLRGAAPCTTRAVTLDPLSTRFVSSGDFLEAQLPFTNQPGFPSGDHYTVEFRSPIQGLNYTVWDAGVAQTVLIHLAGKNAAFVSYLVNSTVGGALQIQGAKAAANVGGTPQFVAGATFVDPTSQAYVAVNQISSGSALVTLGNCALPTTLTYAGDTSADYTDVATLAANLSTNPGTGPAGPIPNQVVNLALGSQGCSATTDANGRAACTITINQDPGSYSATASFAGSGAYAAATGGSPFTITKEETKVTYTGPLTGDYHDQFTASATLTDPADGAALANQPLTFTLGAGDSCGPVTTDGSGLASCPITPSQAAGTVSLVASFAGDAHYLSSSDTRPFVISREQTTTVYTGPTVIANGINTHFTAVLKEDGSVPLDMRPIQITLGSGSTAQTCTGTTDPSGSASCDIVPAQPLGPGSVRADFLGDSFYLPSSDGASTISFAFLDKGAFVIGNGSATQGAQVTFFGPRWAKENQVAGGAPNSFKGYASKTSEPPLCGGDWTTAPGDSATPPETLPAYMGVLVASSISKDGRLIAGDTPEIVVVKTSAGFDGHLGTGGTGVVVAVFCHV